MNPQLNYIMARHRSAELRLARERARTATEAPAKRRRLRDRNTTTCPSTEPGRASIALEGERAIGGAR